MTTAIEATQAQIKLSTVVFFRPYLYVIRKRIKNLALIIIPEPTARSAVPGVSPGEGTNFARLFTPGERNAVAKSKVHQISWPHGYDPRVDLLADLKNMAVRLPGVG